MADYFFLLWYFYDNVELCDKFPSSKIFDLCLHITDVEHIFSLGIVKKKWIIALIIILFRVFFYLALKRIFNDTARAEDEFE